MLFAHGSGSSRLSPRNRLVAERLQRSGLGTLLFDLLHPEEASNRRNVLNRLSEGLIGRYAARKREKPRISPGLRLWAVPYTRLTPGQIPLSTQAFIMLRLEPASIHADGTMAEAPPQP